MNDSEIQQAIRSFKMTITVCLAVIVFCFGFIVYVTLLAFPSIVHEQMVSVLTEWDAQVTK